MSDPFDPMPSPSLQRNKPRRKRKGRGLGCLLSILGTVGFFALALGVAASWLLDQGQEAAGQLKVTQLLDTPLGPGGGKIDKDALEKAGIDLDELDGVDLKALDPTEMAKNMFAASGYELDDKEGLVPIGSGKEAPAPAKSGDKSKAGVADAAPRADAKPQAFSEPKAKPETPTYASATAPPPRPDDPAPEGRIWVWIDEDGQRHITKDRPPDDARVVSVSDPPGSRPPIRVSVHDEGGGKAAKGKGGDRVPQTKALPAPKPGPRPPVKKLAGLVLKELNELRADPSAYAAKLEAVKATFQGGSIYRSWSGRLIQSNEGVDAWDEAIVELRATGALPAFQRWAPAVAASKEHAKDLSRRGARGHRGSDRSRPIDRVRRQGKPDLVSVGEVISYGAVSAPEVVISWLVDDGVPSRGHRNALLDPTLTHVGGQCLPHVLDPVCVVTLVER